MQEGLLILRAKFGTVEDIGPVWAARVAVEAGADEEFARRDAFEQVNQNCWIFWRFPGRANHVKAKTTYRVCIEGQILSLTQMRLGQLPLVDLEKR